MSPTVLLVSGALLLASGAILGRIFKANFELDAAGKARKYLGVLAVVIGAVLLLRGAGWIGTPDRPEGLEWMTDLAAAEARAKTERRPLIIDFTADWCKACKELEEKTFSHPKVAPRLAGWVTCRIDLTDDRPEFKPIQKRFDVQGLPTVAFTDAAGRYDPGHNLTGYEAYDAFLQRLDRVESGASAGGGETLADRIGAALAAGTLGVYALIFLAGIFASLSPCVYPLIPITIALFGAREAPSKLHGFGLSLIYVGGIATTYSGLGVLAASTGGLFGAALQSGWVVGAIALLFMAMGLSMLGAFELRLPAALNQRLNTVGGGRSQMVSAFLMGTVAGVVAAPCVGPPLVVVLTFVATSGNIGQGLGLLITYSIGMGLLFMFLGTFTQLIARMPKSGGWMEVVKGSMGLVMLVVGVIYLNDVFPVF